MQLKHDEVAREVAELLKTMKPIRPNDQSDGARREAIAPSTTIPRPPPNPFTGKHNADASALRAATSLLQMQKARALDDIRVLEDLKRSALAEPEMFIDALVKGELRDANTSKIVPSMSQQTGSERGLPENEDKEMTDVSPGAEHQTVDPSAPRFPTIPKSQNIVRMPAINWAKYGIVGDALDKMHEEQRTNPSLGEPEFMATRTSQPIPLDHSLPSSEKAPRHVLAAPYNPLDQK
jgi:hypothetical protein